MSKNFFFVVVIVVYLILIKPVGFVVTLIVLLYSFIHSLFTWHIKKRINFFFFLVPTSGLLYDKVMLQGIFSCVHTYMTKLFRYTFLLRYFYDVTGLSQDKYYTNILLSSFKHFLFELMKKGRRNDLQWTNKVAITTELTDWPWNLFKSGA